MKVFILIIATAFTFGVYAQLRCTERLIDTKNVKTCLHQNGSISTSESWDSEKRWGDFFAYDSQGNEIIHYSLRRIAGHASVYVEYFSNGQIKKLEYTSAPDGGIQYYHHIHYFDESGKQTDYQDLSMPDGHPTLITMPLETFETKPQVVVVNATKSTVFKVVNSTSSKIQLVFQDSLIVLKKQKQLELISFEKQEKFISPDAHTPKLVFSKKSKKHFKLLDPVVSEENNRRVYTWYVVEF